MLLSKYSNSTFACTTATYFLLPSHLGGIFSRRLGIRARAFFARRLLYHPGVTLLFMLYIFRYLIRPHGHSDPNLLCVYIASYFFWFQLADTPI
jgi:hypothetical protein